MKTNLTTLLLVCLVCYFTQAQDWKTYPYSPEGSLISFPKDEGAHTAEAVEWWYTAGEVVGETSGKHYAYMLSYFDYSYGGFDGFRIFNLRDLSTGAFYQSTLPLYYKTLSTEALSIEAAVVLGTTETWSNTVDGDNKIIPFEYTVKASSDAGSIDFLYESVKRPLIIGGTGKIDQGSSKYSYYYSQTKNEVSGKITLNGITENVIGTAWIDRQYGNFNPLSSEKYEWFSLQLSNGMDLNLWNIFTPENTVPNNSKYKILSAYVNEDTRFTIHDFNIERLAFNWMPDEAKCYSKKWHLTAASKGIDLTIENRYTDAEIQLPFRFYEGATTITGTINGVEVTGIGFSELVHSYEHPEISISSLPDQMYTPGIPVTWELENPDDGRPIYYDILFSTDETNFMEIASNLTDTSFTWDSPTLEQGDTVTFKVVAHSIDNALISETTSDPWVFSTLSVEESVLNQINIFPNPVQSQLHLHVPQQLKNLNVQVIDISGRIVSQIKVPAGSSKIVAIDTKNFHSGFYYLHCISNGAKKSFKFIKK
ncbi:lipocalin-like domain-containing protein [Formosa haliotis]|uniref:lipocalin-like domain-containing protein n=1 Tax=Formosa haliotis TaxID=1555194 RepID=UPI0008268B16|nr:lipocalin-like domain-containing protein [Formosa haliotis]